MGLLDSVGRSLGLGNPKGAPGLPPESMVTQSTSPVTGERLAAEIVDRHRKAKQARWGRDLTADKYLIHIDGEGLGQYVDIYGGSMLMIPPNLVGSLMLQRNLLRPMVDNMVAYHTAMEFRVAAESASDKKSRDQARIDTLVGNHYIVQNNLNELVADSLYLGAAYGYGCIHASWRDFPEDPFDPPSYLKPQGEGQPDLTQHMVRGSVDFWLGDPWDHTYNEGATRHSVGVRRYGRVLPLSAVKLAFGHVPGIEKLTGSDNLSSASRFQRTLKRWSGAQWAGGGTAYISGGLGGEELVALVCEEVAPRLYGEWPEGRLAIAAIQGQATTDSDAYRAMSGSCMLLHDGPLPTGRFSANNFYTGFRGDDVLGGGYVKDLDDLQVQLNDLVTNRAEIIRRWARPPWLARAGAIEDDSKLTMDDALIEYTSAEPPILVQGGSNTQYDVESAIKETLDEMFRIGGWQAASRGESNPGDPAAKVVALARADDTVFGPVNRQIRGAISELLGTAHALTVAYMTVPLLLELTGDEWGHIADPWVKAHQMSPRPPKYRVTSGFGASPEARAQQLLNLVGMVGADGQPLLTSRQFWQLYPDHSLRPPEQDATRVKEMRAQARNYAITTIVEQGRQQYGDQLEQMAEQLHYQLSGMFPIERSDDPEMHVEVLDQLIHSIYEDPVARQLARWQQALYYDFMNQIAMQQMQAAALGGGAQQQQGGDEQARAGRMAESPKRPGQDLFGGTVTSNALSPETLAPTVNALTSHAREQENNAAA